MTDWVTRPGVRYVTISLVIIGLGLEHAIVAGYINGDSQDHTVPRVPIAAVPAASGGVSTSTAVTYYASNTITGEELQIPLIHQPWTIQS